MLLAHDIARGLSPVSILEEAGQPVSAWQRRCLDHWGKDQHILVTRHGGKSSVGAAMALHVAMYHPGHPVVLVGRAGRQSVEIFRIARLLYDKLKSPPRLIVDGAAALELENRSRILALPGDSTTVRGISGASAVIVDESAYVSEDMLIALEPMLSTTGGPLWLMSTAAGKRGFFYDYHRDKSIDFFRTIATADDCPHISPEFLAKRRKRWPEWYFQQEFYCEFRDNNESAFTGDLIARLFSREVEPIWA